MYRLSNLDDRSATYTILHSFSLIRPRPPRSTLFPYTTLFRSASRRRTPCSTRCSRTTFAAVRTIISAPSHKNIDRKSTRLNSSHVRISYAVFCLKKKKQDTTRSCAACLSFRHCLYSAPLLYQC